QRALVSRQRFILCLQGRTAGPARLGGPDFDEAAFEERLHAEGMPVTICWHYVLRLQACFLYGDLAGALSAAALAAERLWASRSLLQVPEHHFYHALTLAAVYPACAE